MSDQSKRWSDMKRMTLRTQMHRPEKKALQSLAHFEGFHDISDKHAV